MTWNAPNPSDALTFDEVEEAGLDGTLRTMTAFALPPITVDMMLSDYMREVRSSWLGIRNVAAIAHTEGRSEIIYEIIETAERCRPDAMRALTSDGCLSDVAWDMAEAASKAAIECCQIEYPRWRNNLSW